MTGYQGLQGSSSEVCSVRVKRSWTLIVFRSLWVLLVLGFSVPIVQGIIEHERWEVVVLLAPFHIACVYIVRQVLWSARGREILLVVDDGLVIRRTGSFWMWDVHVAFHEFEKTSVDRIDPGFLLGLLGFGEHVLHIRYLDRKVRVGAFQNRAVLLALKERIDKVMNHREG